MLCCKEPIQHVAAFSVPCIVAIFWHSSFRHPSFCVVPNEPITASVFHVCGIEFQVEKVMLVGCVW